MGLFDKFGGSREIALTPKSALALAALTVVGADGAIDDEEIDGLRRVVRGDEDAFRRAFEVYKAKEIDECIELVAAALDDKQKAAAIVNLLDIAMADGVLAGAEERLLEAYASLFGLPEETLKKIIDVIALKNDFSVF